MLTMQHDSPAEGVKTLPQDGSVAGRDVEEAHSTLEELAVGDEALTLVGAPRRCQVLQDEGDAVRRRGLF